MSSPDPSLLRRVIDFNFANRRRSMSVKWLLLNTTCVALLVYNLFYKCVMSLSWTHYMDMVLVGVLMLSIATHCCRLLMPTNAVQAPTPQTPFIDSMQSSNSNTSFDTPEEVVHNIRWFKGKRLNFSSDSEQEGGQRDNSYFSQSLLLIQNLFPHQENHVQWDCKDEFIADRNNLSQYIRAESEKMAEETSPYSESTLNVVTRADIHHQLSLIQDDLSTEEYRETTLSHLWRRLRIDPTQLTKYNLNLRRWLHSTILARVMERIVFVNSLLERSGYNERIGNVALARLRVLEATAPLGLASKLKTTLPFLPDHPDQRYVIGRIKELSTGTCLSKYRWDGGNVQWRPPLPTDAEIVLVLFEAYIQATTDDGFARSTPRFHQTNPLYPPHFVVQLDNETIDVGRGRNNLLHAILAFIALTTRAHPTLSSTKLDASRLNMSWIIGR